MGGTVVQFHGQRQPGPGTPEEETNCNRGLPRVCKRSDCRNVRKLLAFDRCLRSVGAERNRGSLLRSSYSHPVSSSRTAPALISHCSFGQWNLWPACCGGLPYWSAGIAAIRGPCRNRPPLDWLRSLVACCRLDRAPCGTLPYWSAGRMADAPAWGGSPLFGMAGRHWHTPKGRYVIAGHPSRPSAGVKCAVVSSCAVCVERMHATLCAFGRESEPPRWGKRPPGPFPSVGASTGSRSERVASREVSRNTARGVALAPRREAGRALRGVPRTRCGHAPGDRAESRRDAGRAGREDAGQPEALRSFGERCRPASARATRSRYLSRERLTRSTVFRALRRLARSAACRSRSRRRLVRSASSALATPSRSPRIASSARYADLRDAEAREIIDCVADAVADWDRFRVELRCQQRLPQPHLQGAGIAISALCGVGSHPPPPIPASTSTCSTSASGRKPWCSKKLSFGGASISRAPLLSAVPTA